MPRKRKGRKGRKGGSPTMREFQANKLLEVTKVDASRSVFNAIGGNQKNLTDGRTYHKWSIVENMHCSSDHTIILMTVCFCIAIAFM